MVGQKSVHGRRNCPVPGSQHGDELGVFGELKADPGGWCRVRVSGSVTPVKPGEVTREGGSGHAGPCRRGEEFGFHSKSE